MANSRSCRFVFHHILELLPGARLEIARHIGLFQVEHDFPLFFLLRRLLFQVLDIAYIQVLVLFLNLVHFEIDARFGLVADLVAYVESVVVAGPLDEIVKSVLNLELLGGVGVGLVLLHADLAEDLGLDELVLIPILEGQVLTVRALARPRDHANMVLGFHLELALVFHTC